MGRAGGHAGGQDLVLVLAAAGEVEPEPPDGGRSTVAEPDEGLVVAVGQFAFDVGELDVVADVQACQLRPAIAGVLAQSLGQGGLGLLRDGGHEPYLAVRRVDHALDGGDRGEVAAHPRKITESVPRVRPPRSPDCPDRLRARAVQGAGPFSYDPLPAGRPRPDRAGRRAWLLQRPYRPATAGPPRYRPPVAWPILVTPLPRQCSRHDLEFHRGQPCNGRVRAVVRAPGARRPASVPAGRACWPAGATMTEASRLEAIGRLREYCRHAVD